MSNPILSTVFITMLLFINHIAAKGLKTHDELVAKRSDRLIHELVHQMVAEQLERKTLMEKFRKMENEVDDVKRSLEERNTFLEDTKDLEKKLEGLVEGFNEEVRESTKDDVKKAINGFKENLSTMSDGLRKDMKVYEKTINKKISSAYQSLQNYLKLRKKNAESLLTKTNHRISTVRRRSFGKIKTFHNKLVVLQKQVASYLNSAHGAVAFSAMLNKQMRTSSALVFGKILTKVGGGYHSSGGFFICPRAGMYMFSVTLQAYSYSYVQGYIMKNDNQVALLYNQAYTTTYPAGSLTLMIQLKTGDKVWVKGVGHTYYNYSYFSGSLITL